MDLSVCIVSWNTKDLLRKCIQSILEKTSGLDYEIIVVDNDSKDGSPDMVRQEFPACKLISSGQNLGFARANNLAVRHASGKYIIYLNPDTELLTNALSGMLKYLKANTACGAVGCKLLNPDGTIQYTCARAFPSPFNQFCELAGLNRLFPAMPIFSAIEMHYWDHRESRYVECLSGACMMVRKEIVYVVNGLDENLFMYAEDVDLCYRIKQEGWRLFYKADEEIMHHIGASSKKKDNRHFSTIQIRESNCYYFRKHFGLFTAIQYRAAVLMGSLIRLASIPMYVLFISNSGHESDMTYLFRKYLSLVRWSIGASQAVSNK